MVKKSEVTYGQLDKALRALGFSCRLSTDEPPTRVYQHKTTGSMILLPALPERPRVFAVHLVAVRTELDNFGIVNPTAFAAQLQKAG